MVMQLDRPDESTSLFIKAPWSVAMAVGNLLHRAGSEGTSLRARAFPHDDDLPRAPAREGDRAGSGAGRVLHVSLRNPGPGPFNSRAPGTQLRLKPLVYSEEKKSLLAAPGLTISLKLPQAESASPTP